MTTLTNFIFAWNPAFSVGNRELDEQHQRLLRICQHLDAFIEDDTAVGVEQFHIVLNDLSEYANQHFKTEERIMRNCGYPSLAEQTSEHNNFQEQLAGFLLDATNGYLNRKELRQFLIQWWQDHILESDLLYAPYLKALA